MKGFLCAYTTFDLLYGRGCKLDVLAESERNQGLKAKHVIDRNFFTLK